MIDFFAYLVVGLIVTFFAVAAFAGFCALAGLCATLLAVLHRK